MSSKEKGKEGGRGEELTDWAGWLCMLDPYLSVNTFSTVFLSSDFLFKAQKPDDKSVVKGKRVKPKKYECQL